MASINDQFRKMREARQKRAAGETGTTYRHVASVRTEPPKRDPPAMPWPWCLLWEERAPATKKEPDA